MNQITHLPVNCWYAVAPVVTLTEEPLLVPFAGQDYVLFRNRDGKPVCFSDRCPHRGASLSLGTREDGCIRCPFHGWLFDGGGHCIAVPADGDGATLPARSNLKDEQAVCEHAGFIWLWLGEQPADHSTLPNLPEFSPKQWQHVSNSFTWDAHFSRVIESNLDNSHAYWVHKGTFASQDSPLSIPYDLNKGDDWVSAKVKFDLPLPSALKLMQRLQGKGPGLSAETTFSFFHPNLNIVDTRVGDFLHVIFVNASLPQSESQTISRWIKYSPKKAFNMPGREEKSTEISRTIFNEDHGVVQSQRPYAVPLDFSQESHVNSDVLSIEYRKILKRKQKG
ncbi:aromatic ring-hydroxylating dioxygenase subunit alpha [Vulcanococcus sp.]|uniref:aromatic ring-hydroxylating dioxygenase subunit alpha n=1 Tax=Vulcanococcus sp. TaxID=2856995 RepID=UPI003F6A3C33